MKSIFDGWTTKIENVLRDDHGGYCAVGWAISVCSGNDEYGLSREGRKAMDRVGGWIITNMEGCPERVPLYAVVWANNQKKLDIEGFRMVDLLTQGYVPDPVTQGHDPVTEPVVA